MPAITVDDITILPRIPTPDPLTSRPRRVRSITTAPSGFEGEGFPVRRAFAGVDLRELDPFIHLDQMGEVEYAPGEPKGTPWHPHRGFETVTNIIDRLEDDKLIRRVAHPSDARTTLAEITPRGRKVADATTRDLNAIVYEQIGLSERKRNQLLDPGT